MGEIIDLEFYRRQRKRRLGGSYIVETDTVETHTSANRRNRRRNRTERDRLRPAIDPPAVEFLDRGRGSVDPATKTEPADSEPSDSEPGDKSAD